MAFMGRGSGPDSVQINIGNSDNSSKDNMNKDYYVETRYYGQNNYYEPSDKAYIIMQIIAVFIIVIVSGIAIIVTYRSSIVDPIEKLKVTYIKADLIMIGILLLGTLLINFFSKKEDKLIERLLIILIISVLGMMTFVGIKIKLDMTYNEDKFEQFYEEQNTDVSSESELKNKIDIGLLGMGVKTEKEYYIDECSKLYGIFSAKFYGMLVAHLLLNMVLIYQILRVEKIKKQKDRLNKDDLILNDEEENVKI